MDFFKHRIAWWYKVTSDCEKTWCEFVYTLKDVEDFQEAMYHIQERYDDLSKVDDWGIDKIEDNDIPYFIERDKLMNGASAGSYVGDVHVSYDTLLKHFGEPDGPSGDHKVLAWWDLVVRNPYGNDYYTQVYARRDTYPKALIRWSVCAISNECLNTLDMALCDLEDNYTYYNTKNSNINFISDKEKEGRRFKSPKRVEPVEFEIESLDEDRAKFVKNFIVNKTGDDKMELVKRLEKKIKKINHK